MIRVRLQRSHYNIEDPPADYEAVAYGGLPFTAEITAWSEPEEGGYEKAVEHLHNVLQQVGINDEFDDFVCVDREAVKYANDVANKKAKSNE